MGLLVGALVGVYSSVGLEEPAELNNAVTAPINLRWVCESGQFDGLANGTECFVNRLRSDLIAPSVFAFPDPDSKG